MSKDMITPNFGAFIYLNEYDTKWTISVSRIEKKFNVSPTKSNGKNATGSKIATYAES